MANQVYSYSSASHQNIIVLNCVKSFPRPALCERHVRGKLASGDSYGKRALKKHALSLDPSPICVFRLWREYCLLGGFRNLSELTDRK